MGILKKITKKNTEEKAAPAKQDDVKAAEKETKKVEKKAPAKAAAPAPSKKDSAAETIVAHDVFVRPHVSEKSISNEAAGTYTFVVRTDATKIDVKQAVKAMYGVLPARVRMMNVEGKRSQRGRLKGKRADWKKAIVTLPKGKTISIHEGV